MTPRLHVASIGSLVLLAIAGGCSGSTSTVPASSTVLATVRDARGGRGGCGDVAPATGQSTNPMMYTAQLYGHDIKVYGVGGSGLQYECSLTQGVKDPNGSMTTTNGWLYVANGGGENVLVYRSKKGSLVG